MSAQACHLPYQYPYYPYEPYGAPGMPLQGYGTTTFTPYPVTEERIREILREELANFKSGKLDEGTKEY